VTEGNRRKNFTPFLFLLFRSVSPYSLSSVLLLFLHPTCYSPLQGIFFLCFLLAPSCKFSCLFFLYGPVQDPFLLHSVLACAITHLTPTSPHIPPAPMPTFHSPCTSTLKMEATSSSGMLVSNHMLYGITTPPPQKKNYNSCKLHFISW
jgi:hypothetical protein